MKNIRQSIFSVIVPVVAHAIMCIIYNYTYYSSEFKFSERFSGVLYWVMLITAFLAGPFFYYIAGRIRKDKGDKKVVLITLFVLNGVFAVVGVAAMLVPSLAENTYRIFNAPSYMYYLLFKDAVLYISIPAMIITAFFPAFFYKLGFTKKPRTNNEIKVEDIEIKEEKEL